MGFVEIGYIAAAIAWGGLAVIVVFSRRFAWPLQYVLATSVLMVVWAGAMLWVSRGPVPIGLVIGLDSLHAIAALLFLGQLVSRGNEHSWRRWFAYSPWFALPIAAVLVWRARQGDAVGFDLSYYFIVLVAIVGLLAVEQIYRNAQPLQRRLASLVATSFAMLFIYDLFVYSNAILFGGLDYQLWAARGFINALVVPVLVYALKRGDNWSQGLFVSRQVVFYSSSLVGVGLYLVVVAFGGALLEEFGGDWGVALRGLFLVASLLLLALVLFSQALRRRIKVFIATHFYANRYDYREQWLKLIRRLVQDSGRASMPEQCLAALADIVDSPAGVLWLYDAERDEFHLAATLGGDTAPELLDADAPVIAFLRDRRWVIDGREALASPDHYDNAFDVERDPVVTSDRIIVPVVLEQQLSGIAALSRPPGMPALNFEDHDLLRTVGQQLAVFLLRDRAREQISEAREFEVFNRFTAFIMHDLKNLIAQQRLVVANAEKHKSNPAFVDDAIATIANSVQRMERLLAALQSDRREDPVQNVDLDELLAEVVAGAESRAPAVSLVAPPRPVMVKANPERLESVLGHLVRNAQDATQSGGGEVRVELSRVSDQAVITISDSGVGMSSTFMRERLFKPFSSTKGAQGMGIGAYQARAYIRELGGRLEVESMEGVGTTFTAVLPCAPE